MTGPQVERLVSRRDSLLIAAKWLLLICAGFWLTSIAFYDAAADPGIEMKKILLPARLSFALLQAGVDPLPIRRIWGGPATLFGLRCFEASLFFTALVALGYIWFRRRRVSRVGAGLLLLSMPLFYLGGMAARPLAFSVYIKADQLEPLARSIERTQPGAIATLREGGRLPLPEDAGGVRQLRAIQAQGRIIVQSRDPSPPLRDRKDAEAMRFALAQQAWLAGDRVQLRRMLPLRLTLAPTDLPSRNDIARRLAAIEHLAGTPAVAGEDRSWVAAGDAAWARAVRLIHLNRYGINILLWPGLVLLVVGLILGRRVKKIERHLATGAGGPPPPPLVAGFGRAAGPGRPLPGNGDLTAGC